MTIHYADDLITLHLGKAEEVGRDLKPRSVQTIITSPPYFGLRDYGADGQTGAERTVGEYVDRLTNTFRILRDALADDGTLWLNLGDSYAGNTGGNQGASGQMVDRAVSSSREAKVKRTNDLPPKNLIGVPWRVAFALQDDGWILRSDIIWAKPNPMPESVTDRPTKAHEYLFLLAKSPRYFYDAAAIAEPTAEVSLARAGRRRITEYETPGQTRQTIKNPPRFGGTKYGDDESELHRTKSGEAYVAKDTSNKRTVWHVPTVPFPGSHFAVYPPELIRPCVLAGSRRGDVVLDPFSGSGTTGMVATQEGRRYVGIDLNAEYLDLSLRERFQNRVLDLTGGIA